MDQQNLYITVLFVQQGYFWVAQALEYDLVAQGSSIENAKRGFEHVFLAQLALDRRFKRAPLSTLSRAPEHYWQLFRALLSRRPQMTTEAIHTDVPSDAPPAFMVQAFADTPPNHTEW